MQVLHFGACKSSWGRVIRIPCLSGVRMWGSACHQKLLTSYCRTQHQGPFSSSKDACNSILAVKAVNGRHILASTACRLKFSSCRHSCLDMSPSPLHVHTSSFSLDRRRAAQTIQCACSAMDSGGDLAIEVKDYFGNQLDSYSTFTTTQPHGFTFR
jgi:hypothetical protein